MLALLILTLFGWFVAACFAVLYLQARGHLRNSYNREQGYRAMNDGLVTSLENSTAQVNDLVNTLNRTTHDLEQSTTQLRTFIQ